MAPIRLGIIGLSTEGWASLALVPPLLHDLLKSHYTLTALSTRSESSALKAAKKYSELFGNPVKAFYGPDGAKQLATDPEVDMVAISVKMPDHKAALDAFWGSGKKLLFIEWSPGTSYAETLKIAEKAKKEGVRTLVGGQGLQSAALRTVQRIIDSGKIGEILSTSALISLRAGNAGRELITTESNMYALDINAGANLLSVLVGHFLFMLTEALGDFKTVTATGQVQISTSQFQAADGTLTGKVLPKTTHDQVSLSGLLKPKDSTLTSHDIFVNIHGRSPLPIDKGRKAFQWIIDGTKGSIEVVPNEKLGSAGSTIHITEPVVILNGEVIASDENKEDVLGNTGKAWLEFATEGRYTDLEKSVKIHRVIDAGLSSINNGHRVDLA